MVPERLLFCLTFHQHHLPFFLDLCEVGQAIKGRLTTPLPNETGWAVHRQAFAQRFYLARLICVGNVYARPSAAPRASEPISHTQGAKKILRKSFGSGQFGNREAGTGIL